MKHIVLGFAVAVFLATSLTSCDKQEVSENHVRPLVEMSFSATTIETPDSTKTSTNHTEIYWQDGDMISVFALSDAGNNPFSITSGAGTTSANFQGSAVQASSYYALYPYQQNARLDGTTIKDVCLPRRQVATPGSFDPRCNLMAAVTDGSSISFKQVCSYIKVTPAFDCKQITIKSNNNGNPLTGKCDITFGQDGVPAVSVTNDTAIVTLLPANGSVSIAGGQSYLIAVFPGSLSKGFMVSFTATDDRVYIYKHTSSVTLSRRNILDIMGFSGWTATVDYVQLWANGPKWATVNLGATTSSESGDYFAWGEIEPYYYVAPTTNGLGLLWRTGKTGYLSDSYSLGYVTLWDAGGSLQTQFDAASQLWGGGWSMPSESDLRNLLNSENCVVVVSDGNCTISGKGAYSQNSIFLPLSGSFEGSSSLSSLNTKGKYWSKTRDSSQQNNACYLSFSSTTVSVENWTRHRGYTIRPVIR